MYDFLIGFFVYGFLGWCVEVVYHALDKGILVNRGFLNGTICPIYGFGVLGVVYILSPIANNLLLVFIGSIIVCSVLEFFTGFIMKKMFHQSWWDYSDQPYNIGGYICLKFSVMWGIACVFVVRLIHPSVEILIEVVPTIVGKIVLVILILVLIIDCIATIKAILGINKELRIIDEAALIIKDASDELTNKLYNRSVQTSNDSEKMKYEAVLLRNEIETELKERIEKANIQKNIINKKLTYSQKRIIDAFPNMKSTRYNISFDEMKGNLEKEMKRVFEKFENTSYGGKK